MKKNGLSCKKHIIKIALLPEVCNHTASALWAYASFKRDKLKREREKQTNQKQNEIDKRNKA